MRKIIVFIIVVVITSASGITQTVDQNAATQLEALSETVPGLKENIKVDVGKSSLQSFIAGIGRAHNLNVSVDPSLSVSVAVNFSDETVLNVLIYLIEKYNLELKVTGTIMTFSPKQEIVPQKKLNITYDKANHLLSYDLTNESLEESVKKITELSGENIVLDPTIRTKVISGYIKNLPLESALQKLTISNALELSSLEDGTYYVKTSANGSSQAPVTQKEQKPIQLNTKDILLSVNKGVNGEDLVSVSAINKSIADIIKYMFQETGRNYIFFAEPNENTTVSVKDMLLEDFLGYLLNASDFTFKENDDIFLIGLRSNEKLRDTKLVKLMYRSLTDVQGIIPGELKNGVNIQEFPELNSLVLSGSSLGIQEIETLLRAVDQPVPVVMIELIIVDVNKTNNISSGVEMGLSQNAVETQGTVLPGVDVTLSSSTINEFLNTIGLTNLGRVTPNFYVSLSAMETNGNINIQSTPKLATLNSHEATLSIGETSYYLEQQQNVIGTQNPQTVVTNLFKPVNADFSITINPTVSGDEQVTLEVSVNQSNFTNRISPNAPPGQTNRDFQSIIRVKNEEMIVLGGLERTNKSQTGSGLPLLSRIPILKWFFGKRQKTNEKSKLIIFIKPSIVY